MKDIQRTFMYHGGEHKCINCVENGLPLNVENVMKSSRFHKRCGTSFLFFVVIISAILLMLIRSESHSTRLVIRILLIPVVAGISYEFIRLAGTSENKCINVLSKPGLAMQKFTTREPDETMAEVAIAAVEAVFDWRAFLKENYDLDVPKYTLSEACIKAAAELQEAEVEESGNIARELMLYLKGMTKNDYALRSAEVLNDTDRQKYFALIDRIKAGEPLQYITGKADFYGYEFKVTPDVLIPRFDTEVLVKAALDRVKEGSPVLDLCTGSGCIIISMCKEKVIKGTGADISNAALKIASENAAKLGVHCSWIKSDMFNAGLGKYGMIVSNPPYIKTEVIGTLDANVKDHEPLSALDGGEDGLDYYRIIAKEAKRHLLDGGDLLVEIGFDQAAEVTGLFKEAGYDNIEVIKDLSGLDRVVACRTGKEA